MGRFALLIGVPPLAGPFILSSIAFIVAGLVLFMLLRPDPLKMATIIEAHKQENAHGDKTESLNKKALNK